MATGNKENGYGLSRDWFDFCFENPDLITPTHTAMYFFIIEHCNRLGWKEKFGLPMEMTKDAIGIKNYRTYSNTLNDLIEWGFINLIQKSKNQYSSCIIAIARNTIAHTKALDKAMQKHSQKQGQSIVCIDKQRNLKTLKQEENNINTQKNETPQTPFEKYRIWILKDNPNVAKMKNQMTEQQMELLLKNYGKDALFDIINQMDNKKDLNKKYLDVYKTANSWLKRK